MLPVDDVAMPFAVCATPFFVPGVSVTVPGIMVSPILWASIGATMIHEGVTALPSIRYPHASRRAFP
jgi:hypothetical protein